MKWAEVLFMCLVFIEFTQCVDRNTSTRIVKRRKNNERNERQIKSSPVPLELIALTLQEELDRVEKFNEKIMNILSVLDGKINKINDKLFSEKISEEMSSINDRLVSWEKKINELDEKLNTLINQNEKCLDDDKKCEARVEQPLLLKITDSEQSGNLEIIVQEIKDSLKEFENSVQRNLSENGEKLDHIKRAIFEQQHLHKNSSDADQFAMQIQSNQRKERRIAGKANLVNEILSMVKKQLHAGDEGESKKQKSEYVSSLTDMIANFENMKSTVAVVDVKNKTATNSSTSRGITFPNVKNKPAKINTTLFVSEAFGNKDIRGFSCFELMNAGMRQSGVYYLQIRGTTYWFLKVFCEQEIADGGWTVIQRRDDYGEPRENFNRDWADYKNGFGDPAKEFWMGNENIFMLTDYDDYALRIELEDFEGNKRYAQYSHFKLHSEADYYKLEIDGYEGNAGDSLNDLTYGSNNSPFSTYNRDNDRSSLNCASMLKGAWWWRSCGRGLNGIYPNDSNDSVAAKQGIIWFTWNGWNYTLKKSTMMIKPLAKQMTT